MLLHRIETKATLVLCLLSFALQTGCLAPTIESKAFNEMPRIGEFANKEATNQCFVFELEDGHRSRVCAFGRLRNDQKIEDLFPFLSDKTKHLGADALHGRIPKPLFQRAKLVEPFKKSDGFWVTDVVSDTDKKSIAVRIATAEEDQLFYLEYEWSL